MPKSLAERAGIPLSSTAASAVPHPEDPAWKAWMGHVDAWRIGSVGQRNMTRAQLATLVRNEMVLTGRGEI